MPHTSISIGAVGGVQYDAGSDRLKGILTDFVDKPDDVGHLIQRYISNRRPPASRVTVRLFTRPGLTRDDLDQVHIPWRGAEITCEAFIPMSRNDIGGVAYFGGNAIDREACTREDRIKERELLRGVMSRPINGSRTPDEIIEFLERPDDQDITDLLAVYMEAYDQYMTPFTRVTIAGMCRDNLVAIARNTEGRIVAVSQGEKVMLSPLNLTLVELTETATLPAYRSRGLTTFCKRKIIETVSGPQVQIYAESRANWGGVLRQNHSIGMRVAGRLERHCLISSTAQDIRQTGRYGNLLVFYLPN